MTDVQIAVATCFSKQESARAGQLTGRARRHYNFLCQWDHEANYGERGWHTQNAYWSKFGPGRLSRRVDRTLALRFRIWQTIPAEARGNW